MKHCSTTGRVTLADGDETDRVEEHLFACGDCSARLHDMASLGAGLAALAHQGRVTGIVSRTLLNRMQRDGVHVRLYSVVSGETVPCAVFPADDLVVAAMRADFSAADAVTLSVMGPGDSPIGEVDDVPVSRSGQRTPLGPACRSRASDAIDAAADHARVRWRDARRTRHLRARPLSVDTADVTILPVPSGGAPRPHTSAGPNTTAGIRNSPMQQSVPVTHRFRSARKDSGRMYDIPPLSLDDIG